jgi:proteasome alpha subunit
MRGYSYDRRDVTGRGLANAYAQTLGAIFSSGGEKPYEVELFVAEIGESRDADQIYRLTYDGSVADEHGFAVMGGSAEQVAEYLEARYHKELDLEAALRLAVDALGHDGAEPRIVTADKLEVAVLDRTRTQPRKFRRLTAGALTTLLGSQTAASPAAAAEDVAPAESPRAPAGESGSDDGAATSPDDPSDVLGDLPDDGDGGGGGSPRDG